MTSLIENAGDYDPVPCPLPECGYPLHLRLVAYHELHAGDTGEALRGLALSAVSGLDLNQWKVVCAAGHVILVPPDDGEEWHLFGECRCEPSGPHEDGCAAGDFGRLRRLVNGPVPA